MHGPLTAEAVKHLTQGVVNISSVVVTSNSKEVADEKHIIHHSKPMDAADMATLSRAIIASNKVKGKKIKVTELCFKTFVGDAVILGLPENLPSMGIDKLTIAPMKMVQVNTYLAFVKGISQVQPEIILNDGNFASLYPTIGDAVTTVDKKRLDLVFVELVAEQLHNHVLRMNLQRVEAGEEKVDPSLHKALCAKALAAIKGKVGLSDEMLSAFTTASTTAHARVAVSFGLALKRLATIQAAAKPLTATSASSSSSSAATATAAASSSNAAKPAPKKEKEKKDKRKIGESEVTLAPTATTSAAPLVTYSSKRRKTAASTAATPPELNKAQTPESYDDVEEEAAPPPPPITRKSSIDIAREKRRTPEKPKLKLTAATSTSPSNTASSSAAVSAKNFGKFGGLLSPKKKPPIPPASPENSLDREQRQPTQFAFAQTPPSQQFRYQ